MISPQELRDLGLFKGASANAVARLATALRERKCAAGEVILHEGDTDAGLHLIAVGSAVVRKRIDKNTAKVLAHLGKGEFFGEMSLLDKQPASAEVAAETDMRIFVLSRNDFGILLSKAPTEALDHLNTLVMGLSGRLRQTTREMVTIYQVARNVGSFESAEALGKAVVDVLATMLGEAATVGFYRWNPFNDEYAVVTALGPNRDRLPAVVEDKFLLGSPEGTASYPNTAKLHPFTGVELPAGHLIVSRSDLGTDRHGLFVYLMPAPHVFEAGDRQVMETVSSVLAPALQTARNREEEAARRDHEERKQKFG